MPLVVQADTGDWVLARMLQGHPEVAAIQPALPGVAVEWEQEGRRRQIVRRGPAEVAGLTETMDNNPLVCADKVEVPGPFATLALVALGSLARAGLLEAVARIETSEPPEEGFAAWLDSLGAAAAVPKATDKRPVLRLAVTAKIADGASADDVAEAYDEAYTRSLYVRIEGGDPAGTPYASLHYRIVGRTLRAEARADRDGKAGAAQIVHTFNVMAGFPESLGITDPLPR